MIDMAAEHGIVEKLGAWYSYSGERIGQGRENARDLLRANPKIADEIEAKLRAKLAGKVGTAPVTLEDAAEDEEPEPAPTSKKRG